MNKNCLAILCIGICAITSFSNAANAQNDDYNASQNSYDESLFIPVVYTLDNAWNTQNHDFTTPVAMPIIPETISDENIAAQEHVQIPKGELKEKKSLKAESENFGEKMLKKLPFKNTLKYTWDIIDGDEDVYFEGLRLDRGNMGLEYKTKDIPVVGTVEAIEIKAEMGKSAKLQFESDYIPMVGRVEGFNFKATAGKNSNVSLRYKTDIDW